MRTRSDVMKPAAWHSWRRAAWILGIAFEAMRALLMEDFRLGVRGVWKFGETVTREEDMIARGRG